MAEPYTLVPLTPLRRAIASRMTEASRTIPHFRVSMDIEMDALLRHRERINRDASDVKVSINDCIIKACASTLMSHPAVNVQWADTAIHQYHQADISVVVAVDGGLATPVLRGAQAKRVQDIAIEVRALAARAAARQLKMDEIVGGSFSVSNLGGYGVDQFDAIINPPQCAILAVGAIKASPRVSEDGAIRVAKVMRTTLSLDHRAIDGATGGHFLATLRQILEQPDALFAA
jgi:pyruvate dehydrogenase E2 component (dihydrolipoamide acetyltransferase)